MPGAEAGAVKRGYAMSAALENGRPIDPRRYHDAVDGILAPLASREPVCLYLETTNRCNLLCTTCPRTFETLEPPGDMSWELFTRIVDQLPNIARVVLHGVGEPMLVKELPRMIQYLKDRGAYVLFNTNGTLLNAKRGRELVDTGLDELRVSLDAADDKTFLLVRGRNYFNRICRNVRAFTEMQAREGLDQPRVSLWLTGLKETVAQLPDFIRLAHDIGVKEVYLQRLVFFDRDALGLARPDQALFERMTREDAGSLETAMTLSRALGISFNASGATEPGASLKRVTDTNPWSLCHRPWTVMYFTANGRALPCCIAPFSQRGYENYTLGDATQQTLREIWNGPAYQSFRQALYSDPPPPACANCGLRWSL
jgi:MoaA/NifB/PqqE/SkfB family radical SAM enzyme